MKSIRMVRRSRIGLLLAASLSGGLLLASPGTSSAASGGTLTVVTVGSNISGLDPGGPTTAPTGAELDAVFDPLFFPTKAGGVMPDLATGYKTSNGGDTITLTLRKGVKFQDGTPFNAAAVKYNIERDASPTQNSECVTYFQTLKSVQTIGTYKIAVTFSRPDPAFLGLMSSQQCALMGSPAAIEKEGKNFGLAPVGTGPFTLDKGGYQLTSGTFTAWPGYWRKGDPKFRTLKVLLVGSDTAAFAAIQSGQAQLYLSATPHVLEEAKGMSQLSIVNEGAVMADAITFNFTKPPFNSLTARQAVAYAINPQPILSAVGFKIYQPYEGLIAKGSWAHTPVPADIQKYDPKRAAALVKAAGGITFAMLSYNDPTNEQIGALLQQQLEAVGMHVTINAMPTTDAISALHSHDYQAADIGPAGGGPVPPNDPDLQFHRWFYSTSPLNQEGIKDPTLDHDLDMATSTFNQATRRSWYEKAQEEIVKSLPFAGFMSEPYYAIATKTLQGFNGTYNFLNLYNMSLGS